MLPDPRKLVRAANEAALECDADILLLNSPMMSDVDARVRDTLAERTDKRERIIVILVTPGGLADTAYRTAAALQAAYETVTVCVAGWCKSAGTLLAIGASDLIISTSGELGPLDVQIAKRDDLGGDRDSGLILNEALERLRDEAFGIFENFMIRLIAQSQNNVTFRTAADIASGLTIGLMAPVFDKIDPIRMGADARAMNIGRDYAIRLNMNAANLRGTEALNMLLNGYPSHSFVIDQKEAQTLFARVNPLEGFLAIVIALLGELATEPKQEGVICFLDGVEDGKQDDDDGATNEAAAEAHLPEAQGEQGADPVVA